MDTVSNDPMFERLVEDFGVIEKDPNKNVDVEEEVKEEKPEPEVEEKVEEQEEEEVKEEEVKEEEVKEEEVKEEEVEDYKPTGEDVARRAEQFLSRLAQGIELNSLDIQDLKRLLKDAVDELSTPTEENKEVKEEEAETNEQENYESTQAEEAHDAAVRDLVDFVKEWVGEEVEEQAIRKVVWAFSTSHDLADKATAAVELHGKVRKELPEPGEEEPVESKEEANEQEQEEVKEEK